METDQLEDKIKQKKKSQNSTAINKNKILSEIQNSDGAAVEEEEETKHRDQSHRLERHHYFPHNVIHHHGQETQLRSTPAQPAPTSVTNS